MWTLAIGLTDILSVPTITVQLLFPPKDPCYGDCLSSMSNASHQTTCWVNRPAKSLSFCRKVSSAECILQQKTVAITAIWSTGVIYPVKGRLLFAGISANSLKVPSMFSWLLISSPVLMPQLQMPYTISLTTTISVAMMTTTHTNCCGKIGGCGEKKQKNKVFHLLSFE